MTVADLQKLGLMEFAQMLPSRARRSLKRGMPEVQKRLLEKVEQNKKKLRTHAREMVILPQMVGKQILVYNGKEFVPVDVQPEMLGHKLGEFAPTRKFRAHGGKLARSLESPATTFSAPTSTKSEAKPSPKPEAEE